MGEPDPVRVASALALNGLSRLQRLDAFIRKHPDHEDARKDRLALLRSRKPHPALESRMVEDAVGAGVPLDFSSDDPWVIHPALWQQAAKKARVEWEAALRRWPQNPLLWRIWLSWRPFMDADKPTRPSTLNFAESLSVFGPRDRWRVGLPVVVHQAIAKECLERQRFQAMADWFQASWKGLLKKDGEYRDYQDFLGLPQSTIIHEALVAALKAQGRVSELPSIEERWKIIQPRSQRN